MIEITKNPIDTSKTLAAVQSELAGASVLFVGSTRKMTNGRETLKLNYQCYEELATKKIAEILELAKSKWNIVEASIVHRVGVVDLGEASIAVAVSSPHRVDCFESAKWLVDELKQQVPIWKQEFWADGSTEWIHPDGATPGEV